MDLTMWAMISFGLGIMFTSTMLLGASFVLSVIAIVRNLTRE